MRRRSRVSIGLTAAFLSVTCTSAAWASQADQTAPHAAQAGPAAVTVITWNIGVESSKNWITDRVSGYSGTDPNGNLQPTVIFGAQEVDGTTQYQKVLDALNTKKPGVVWSGVLQCPAGEQHGCNAIFTDGQIQGYIKYKFDGKSGKPAGEVAPAPRHVHGAIDARIAVREGVVVNYAVTHLESGASGGTATGDAINAANSLQAQDLAAWLGTGPTTILSGDMNAVPFDDTRAVKGKLIPAGFIDSWTNPDPGYTKPPDARLDYILFSPTGVQALGDQLLPEWSQHGTVGSDHIALLGSFNVTN